MTCPPFVPPPLRIAAAALLFAALAVVPATAKTPDGQTPSEETVCDGQLGAAFGLCNAYCEAMDCDSEAPHASGKACLRVFDNFVAQTGGAPPCEVECPCFDASDLDPDSCGPAFTCVDFGDSLTLESFECSASVTVDGCSLVTREGLVTSEVTSGQADSCAELIRTAAEERFGLFCSGMQF